MSREVVGSRDAGRADDDARAVAAGGTVTATTLDQVGRTWRGSAPTPTGDDDARGRSAAVQTRDLRHPDGPDGPDGTDGPDGSGPAADPPRLPGGRRGLVAALLVGALVGGLLAVGVVQRTELRRAQSTASVQAWVEQAPNRGSADAVALTLHVVNTGQAPVEVVGVAMNARLADPGPVSVVLTEAQTVRPGRLGSMAVDAQSECDGTPLASGSTTDGRLQLRLRTDDGREQLIDPATGGLSLTSADVQELFCGQAGTRLGLTVAAMQPRPGGELSMSLLNDSPRQLTLEFSSPVGTRVVSDTTLPTTIRSGLRTTLVIRLEVDSCTNDAGRLQAGDDVQLVIDGRARRGGLDSALVAAWVAQRVAQEC